jgi:hypothetical protein
VMSEPCFTSPSDGSSSSRSSSPRYSPRYSMDTEGYVHRGVFKG